MNLKWWHVQQLLLVWCHLMLTDFFIQERNAFFRNFIKMFIIQLLTRQFSSRQPDVLDNLICFLSSIDYISSHKLVIEQDRYNGMVRVERIWGRVPFLSLFVPCLNIHMYIYIYKHAVISVPSLQCSKRCNLCFFIIFAKQIKYVRKVLLLNIFFSNVNFWG